MTIGAIFLLACFLSGYERMLQAGVDLVWSLMLRHGLKS